MSALLKADDNVIAVLKQAKIDDEGLTLQGQLSRPDYIAVNKFLDIAGAKWNRGKAKHVFVTQQAGEKIKKLLLSGELLDEKNHFQAFYTPKNIAQEVVNLACIEKGMNILEPSAGNGALAVPARDAGGNVTCIEMNPYALEELEMLSLKTIHTNFLDASPIPIYDRIIMNPPFTKGQDIKHILHAMKFLKEGGILVAICANGSKQQEKLKPLVEKTGGVWQELPTGSFKCSGTNVNTVLLSIKYEDQDNES